MTIQNVSDITSFKWGVITALSPLAVKLDGDSAALALIPDSLVDPSTLSVGSRVRVELSLRRVVIHGVANAAGALVPGEIKLTAAAAAPTGWLLCQGQTLLRSAYPALFAAIGTTYGAPSGTQFSLPNLQGKVPVGRNAAETEFDVMGETGGAKTHTLTTAEIPSHQHFVAANTSVNASTGVALSASNQVAKVRDAANDYSYGMDGGGTTADATQGRSSAVGGGGAHNNLQPYIVLNYMIKI